MDDALANYQTAPSAPAGAAAFCDVRSRAFLDLRSQLEIVVAALEGVACAANPHGEKAVLSAAALQEAFRLYGRGLDLVRTLKTICRAHLGLNAAGTTAVSARSDVSAIALRLDRSGKKLFLMLESAEDPAALPAELRLWSQAKLDTAPAVELEDAVSVFAEEMRSRVLNAVSALHTHLTSTMAAEVRTGDGRLRIQGFGASVAVLKNSDDPVLRETTFRALNGWLAAHAAPFLDALNAITGFRITLERHSSETLLEGSLRKDRTDLRVYNAMFDALEEALPAVREAVALRAPAFGPGPMKVWNVLSPAPMSIFSKERSLELALSDMSGAFRDINPHFCAFLERALRENWFDLRGLSRKSGGAWSDDLPAVDAVHIQADYLPTIAGEAALSHLVGAAYQMFVMHEAPMPARLYPLSITEIMGNVCETRLFRFLAERARESQDRAMLSMLGWQVLRRITNCLLVIPARHALLKGVLAERRRRALSLEAINAISTESWRHYFGDATDGEDRYVWAYKPHFYRANSVFYDWQYTLGFLLSKALVSRFEATGASACGASLKACTLESGTLSVADFGRRHLGADLRSRRFWSEVIRDVLAPVRLMKLQKPDWSVPKEKKTASARH